MLHATSYLVGMAILRFCILCAIFQSCLFAQTPQPAANVFGSENASESALMGIMYDLKQTSEHVGTGDNQQYVTAVDDFLSGGWDETILNHYYRVSTPRYTTQIFIPNMDAGGAPKAFGVEKLIAPSRWIIQYKGQVSPPAPGQYRFWGAADDVIAVAVNGKTEMVNTRFPLAGCKLVKTTWKASEPDGGQAADDFLRPGDWVTIGPGEIVDLDIIIGEWPGGLFNAFLMIEKKGDSYARDKDGHPILPIFQVAPYPMTPRHDLNAAPDFSTKAAPWKCFQ